MYSGHFAFKTMLKKILSKGYVWPSLQRDVRHWCRTCHQCQEMGKIILFPELRNIILAFNIFEKWADPIADRHQVFLCGLKFLEFLVFLLIDRLGHC